MQDENKEISKFTLKLLNATKMTLLRASAAVKAKEDDYNHSMEHTVNILITLLKLY